MTANTMKKKKKNEKLSRRDWKGNENMNELMRGNAERGEKEWELKKQWDEKLLTEEKGKVRVVDCEGR